MSEEVDRAIKFMTETRKLFKIVSAATDLDVSSGEVDNVIEQLYRLRDLEK